MASGARGLSGHRFSKGWAEDQRVFFATEFSRAPDDIVVTLVSSPEGYLTAEARFRVRAGEPILVKTALSGTDASGAEANLRAELPGWDFDATRAAADVAWNAELGKIDASGGRQRPRPTSTPRSTTR